MLSRLRAAVDTTRLHQDEGVAMMAALIMIMILSSLTLVVLALVVSQVTPTQFAKKNTRTINAAEAGIEAALSQIRTGVAAPDFTGAVYGDLTKLPCTMSAPVTGSGGTMRYSVSVRYFKNDPTGQSETWLNANKMSCPVAVQPQFAYITSQGTGGTVAKLSATAADRTMSTIYTFQTTNTNVAGGRIYTFGDAFCLQADGTTAGSTVSYVAKASCGNDDDRELWLWDTDYEIKLASSMLPGSTALCITGPTTATGATQNITLQPCKSSTDSARWNQLWSWEGGSHWKGENSGITNYSSYCLFSGVTSGDPTGRKLMVGTQCASDAAWGSFDPDPAVGAGAASYNTHQIVNFLEFGRCMDVTGEVITSSYMIVYPCKQDPVLGQPNLKWNHKWFYTEPADGVPSLGPQQVYVYYNNDTTQKYCLQAPTATGGYVTFTSSCSTTADAQKWTRYKDTGNYSSSYTFVDYQGRCIGLSGTDKYNGWSKLIVSSCTGGPDQKWNAPPDKVSASVGNYVESAGG